MSVTVRDVLKLPCMRDARVAAGEGGLDSIVYASSVLEYAEPTKLQEWFLDNMEYMGSELVITAFANVKDSVEDQCNVIRRLSATGDVGIILFYMGVFIKELDEKLIRTADELNFVIIVMPQRRYPQRYSEVISEIQEAIFRDQNHDTYFVGEVLTKISSLPVHQRNMDTLLRIISDRLQLSMLIVDEAWHMLHFASWPRAYEKDTIPILDEIMKAEKHGQLFYRYENEKKHFLTFRLKNVSSVTMNLIVSGDEERMHRQDLEQIVEAVQSFLKMWHGQKGSFGPLDFLQSVIRDEPDRMRFLAKNLGIDEKRIHNMILFKPASLHISDFRKIIEIVREHLDKYCQTVVIDVYDDYVMTMLDDGVSSQWVALLREIGRQISKAGISCLTMYACHLQDTSEVRSAYLAFSESLEIAARLYPRADLLSAYELRFAGQCRDIISQGETAVAENMRILRILNCEDKNLEKSLHETLAVFYFDAGRQTARTAELMFLHKNTIQYRLRKISERLGCSVTDMPEMMDLYRALALERLLEK